MSSLCEIWQFIRAIDNQEPALVAIIKAILCIIFQPYIEECIVLSHHIDDDKYKSLHFPRLHLRKETIIFLLKFGVSPNCYTRYGRTYLHYASEYYLPDIVKILINYGANVTLPVRPMTKEGIEQDKKDEPCEYHSSRRWHQMNNGSTALHLILRDCKEERIDNNEYGHACMKAILDKDPSVIHIKNAHELTPLDMVKDSEAPNTKMKSIMERYME